MPNGPSPFAVTNVRVRQSPRLDANANPYVATIVTFMVGPHGPFQIIFAPGQASPQAIQAAITATVNEQIQIAQGVATLNTQTQNTPS